MGLALTMLLVELAFPVLLLGADHWTLVESGWFSMKTAQIWLLVKQELVLSVLVLDSAPRLFR